jgi:predicted dehydrogenase
VPFHVALIGAGNISGTHAKAAAAVADVVVAAVFGGNSQKAGQLAARSGARAYDSLEACLSHRPLDAVIIGSPSGLHAAQGIAAAERGLHVLVEKPIDVTLDRADALIASADRAGVRLGVLFQDRAQPPLLQLKQSLEDGRLGRPLLASARVPWYRPPEYYAGSKWRGTWALDGGGALMNQGIHTVDLLHWLIGPVRRVSARTATLRHRIEVEDTVMAVLECASGTLATYEATTAAYPGYPRRVELTTTAGTIVVEHSDVIAVDGIGAASDLLSRAPASTNAAESSPVVDDVRGHRRLIEDFVEAVRDGREPACSGREARHSLALAMAMYESARAGGSAVELQAREGR